MTTLTKKERLELLIRHFAEGRNSDFARLLGISPQGLSSWLSRNTFDMELIYSKCVGISAEWLMTGKGEIFETKSIEILTDLNSKTKGKKMGKEQKVQKTLPNENLYISTEPTVSMVCDNKIPYTVGDSQSKDEQNRELSAVLADQGIPLIPLEAVAGFGIENGAQVMEYECERYVIPSFKGAEFLIQVKGSSMYPKYSSGDIVACKKLSLDTFFQWNKVYVIDTEQGVLIKRVKKAADKESVLLVSENQSYDPFEIRRNEIGSLAIVIGVIRLE